MSNSYNLTCREIITEALELLGVIGPGMNANGEDYTSCLRTLNLMIKSWQAPPYGYHLWKIGKGSLFLSLGQQSYQIGGSTSDHVAENATVTELASAAVTSATSLTVDSTTGMTVGDVIGIEQDDGTMKWTTIATLPTSTTMTITAGLASAAAVDNKIYTYTSLAGRPLELSEVRLTKSDGKDNQMYELSRSNYYIISNKIHASSPIQYYTEPLKDSTRLYIYGTGSDIDEYISFNYKKIMDDLTLTTDLADCPIETVMSIIYNLAVCVSPKYEKEDKVLAGIAGKAQELFGAMIDADQEQCSFKVVPNLWWF